MNDYDIIHLMDRYAYRERDGHHYEMDSIKELLHHAQRRTEDPDEELIRQNEYLEERNSDLCARIDELRTELEEAKNEKKVAQRRLKLFIKAASSLKLVDMLKDKIVELVEYEKTNIKFNKFFGITTNHLEQYETELESFEELEK